MSLPPLPLAHWFAKNPRNKRQHRVNLELRRLVTDTGAPQKAYPGVLESKYFCDLKILERSLVYKGVGDKSPVNKAVTSPSTPKSTRCESLLLDDIIWNVPWHTKVSVTSPRPKFTDFAVTY